MSLLSEIESAVNRHCAENESDTPEDCKGTGRKS